MTQEPYSVNGKFLGAFYKLDDGREVFLSHQTPSKRLKVHAAWAINEYVLRRCVERKIEFVGVVFREGSRRIYYLTKLEDYFGPQSFVHFGKLGVQRALPSRCFRISPENRRETIEKRSEIGR